MPVCVVPWLGGDPHRERAFAWLRERSPYPVQVAEGGLPWSKARAVTPAVTASSAEVVVIHDADVWCEGLPEAVSVVQEGAAWAIPHRAVVRLSEQGTREFYESGLTRDLDQAPYLGVPGGGCVVLRRDTYLDCPLDLRFVGWGQEDTSWGFALRTLYGPAYRVKKPLIHLWHPPQERLSRKRGSTESWKLRRRYHNALDVPELMRPLIEEAKHVQ